MATTSGYEVPSAFSPPADLETAKALLAKYNLPGTLQVEVATIKENVSGIAARACALLEQAKTVISAQTYSFTVEC